MSFLVSVPLPPKGSRWGKGTFNFFPIQRVGELNHFRLKPVYLTNHDGHIQPT